MGRKPIDLTGQKFSELLVLSLEKTDKKYGAYWRCQCSCGNITIVQARSLKNGNTKSCGCLRIKNSLTKAHKVKMKDLTGKRFGLLVALEPMYKSYKGGGEIWKCQCDCGNIHYTNAHELSIGRCLSCGCLKSQGEQVIKKLLLEHNISFEQEKTFQTCRFPDTNYYAKFDFYIDNRYLIEYDGIQHFYGWNGNKDNLKRIQFKDNFKNTWCRDNHIPLIRIPYTHLTTICLEDLLLTKSQFLLS